MKNSQTIFKRVFIFVQLILIAFVSVSTITAQTSSVDPSFNPIISKNTDQFNNPIQSNFTLQPDGKILVYGRFQVINGVIENNIARLNADGSLDTSFNCTVCDFNIGSAVVQPDGKVIVAGSSVLSASAGTSAARLRRLNADGSSDTSFNPTSPLNDGSNFEVNYSATVYAVQPDGKVLVVIGSFFSTGSSSILYRLNTNGTFDNTFNTITVGSGRLVRTFPVKISLLPNWKILTATTTTSGSDIASRLNRYNADGSTDSTFEPPSFGNSSNFYINDFETFADGSIAVVGKFDTVNAVSRINIVKLQPAGNVDPSFAPTNVFSSVEIATGVEVYSNGKVLVSSVTAANAPPSQNRFIRYNADGSIDNTFTSPANLVSIRKFVIDGSDSVFLNASFTENNSVVNKFVRLNADGSLASSFSVNFGIGGSVLTAAIQADGKVLVGGDFTQVGNVSRRNIARLNTDGTVDQTFNPQLESNYTVNKLAIQADGKILLGGSFTVNNVSNLGLVRLNADGSLDTAFNPVISNVSAIVQQPDGKILVGGNFTAVNGQTRAALVRLNTDSTTDTSFNATFANGASISTIVLQSDGKIMAGGSFNGVNGFNRSNLVRLNSSGTLDSTFNAAVPFVLAVELYPNGKYIVAAGNSVFRLNNDGTADTSFQSPNLSVPTNSAVFAISVQPDGTIIIGGSFTPDRLARLRADGTIDTTFLPVGANDTVRVIVKQADGKLVIGGDFTMIANVTRLAVARLIVGPVRSKTTLFDFDGDGKADLTVFRPSNGFWYELRSQNNSFYALQFGQSTDKLAPADYDGDGRTDIAVFRENVPGAGDKSYFYITNSSDNAFRFAQFGTQGDLPMSGDWDGDGIADLAVYRNASTAGGQSYFFYRPSSQPGVDFRSIAWGTSGDKPVRGDFDGDGKLDAAVFRPSNGVWYILQSSNNQVIQQPFGLPTDILTPADYDGDGKTNIAVFRPSTGYWYTSTDASTGFGGVQFGSQGDLPVPADYDGDGKADVAVFRPSNGVWYLLQSTAGFTGIQFGVAEDKPIPSIYIR